MERVQSADGTTIAVESSGEGPALVVVVGAFCDRSTSAPLAALLDSGYTVFSYDRRGRGDSGDAATYSVDREVEDLLAVLTATGEAPFVYGHSSGGALALEAAVRGGDIRKLAVYEPPYTGHGTPGPEFGAALDELVRSGHRDEAAERFLALSGAPAEVIGHIKAGPGWEGMLALAHTLSRDLALGNGGVVPVERFASVRVATLALVGGASHGWALDAVSAIAAAVPGAEARVVEGEHHAPAHEVLAPILAEVFV